MSGFWSKKNILSWPLLAGLFFLAYLGSAWGHQPDKIFQETMVYLEPPSFTVDYFLNYGQLLAKLNLVKADKDSDGFLSLEERSDFVRQLAEDIQSKLRVTIDGKKNELVFLNGRLRIPDNQHMIVQLFFEGRIEPLPEGPHNLVLTDDSLSGPVIESWYVSVLAGIGAKTGKMTASLQGLEWNFFSGENLSDEMLETEDWPQTKSSGAVISKAGKPQENQLSLLLNAKDLNPWFIFWAMLLAAGIGALHGLTPGHGKAMVAAYLVGTKGCIRDAVLLGGIVTLTHVSSVVVLGIVALLLSEYILPQQLYPWFGFTSGVLIVLVGIWMLLRQGRDAIFARPHEHAGHEFEGSSHHHHDHIPVEGKVTLSSLIMLGTSGGVVPCPAALVVLFAAVAMHRLIFGLALIFAFSLGLATVLIVIGILVVKLSGFIISSQKQTKWLRFLPLITAVIIILIGFGIAINSLVSADIFSVALKK